MANDAAYLRQYETIKLPNFTHRVTGQQVIGMANVTVEVAMARAGTRQ